MEQNEPLNEPQKTGEYGKQERIESCDTLALANGDDILKLIRLRLNQNKHYRRIFNVAAVVFLFCLAALVILSCALIIVLICYSTGITAVPAI